jgi:hypothetical protein
MDAQLETWKCPTCRKEIQGSIKIVLLLAEEHRCSPEKPERVFFRTNVGRGFKATTTPVLHRKRKRKVFQKAHKVGERVLEAIKTGRHSPAKIGKAAKAGKSVYGILDWLRKQKKIIRIGSQRKAKYYLTEQPPRPQGSKSVKDKVLEAVNAGKHSSNEIVAYSGCPQNTVTGTLTWLTNLKLLRREGAYGKYRWYIDAVSRTSMAPSTKAKKKYADAKIQMIESSLKRNQIFASEPVKKLLLKSDNTFHIIQYLAAEKVHVLTAPMVLRIGRNFQKIKDTERPTAMPPLPKELVGKISEEQIIDFVRFYSENKRIGAADFIRLLYGVTDADKADELFKMWFIPNSKAIIEYALNQPVVINYSASSFTLTWESMQIVLEGA